MFRKQTFFKKTIDKTNEIESKCENIGFKFQELSLDNLLDKPLNQVNSNKYLKIPTINVKDKQRDFANNLYIKRQPLSSKTTKVLHQNSNKQSISTNRKDMFPDKMRINHKLRNRNTLSRYISPSYIINSFNYLNHSLNRQPLDIDNLINSADKPEIKKLVPNRFCLGKDIVPSYLLQKTRKSKVNNNRGSNNENMFNAIIKAHKAHGSYSNNEMNLTFIGFQKSGKSTIIGNILLHLDVLENSFMKKTEWEAIKMNSMELKTAWLMDSSKDERQFKETISSSSYHVNIKGKSVNLIDSPGNLSYYDQIIKSIIKSHYVILVINLAHDWCWTTSELKNEDYFETVFYIMKVFSVDKLELLFVNCTDSNENCLSKIKSLWKKFSKTQLNHSTVNNLSDIQPSELQLLVERIHQFQFNTPSTELDKPLLLEIGDICKPVESALPVIAGCVLRGGISSGVKFNTSKGLILPENIPCTVKSMKIQENDNQLKTKSFAFPGHFVEITMSEINSEDKVKRGSFICHPDYPLTINNHFKVEMRIFDCDIDTPIINGMKVLLWSKCRSCFCEFTNIISVEYYKNKQKVCKKSPRIITKSGCTVIANIRTEEVLAVEFGSLYKLDVFLLFSGLKLFAAGKFQDISS